MKKAKSKLLIVLLAAFTVLFAMDCTCFAASAGPQLKKEAAPMPACHAHTAQPADSQPASDDCCGKCQLERAALIEATKIAGLQPAHGGLYDPFLAAEPHARGPREENFFLPVNRKDLLYQHLFGAHALPRSPPVV